MIQPGVTPLLVKRSEILTISGLSNELPFVGFGCFQASCYQGLMPIRDTDISYLYSVDDQRMYKEVTASSEIKREYYLSDTFEEEALLPKTERRTFCSKARGKVIALRSTVTPYGQGSSTTWEFYAHGSEREARLVPVYSGARFTVLD